MDMVERVAKKIARMVPINGSEWCEGHGHNFPREYHRDDVLLILAISRAAIEAMREPSDEMLASCQVQFATQSMRANYRAMIDSILKSTRETA